MPQLFALMEYNKVKLKVKGELWEWRRHLKVHLKSSELMVRQKIHGSMLMTFPIFSI